MRVALLLPALSLASLAVAAPAPASQDADLDKRTLGFIGDIIDGIFDFNFNWQNWQGSLGGKTCPAVYTYKYDTSKYTCETQTFVSLLPALTYSCTKQRTLCNAVAVTRSWLVWWGHTTSDCTNQYNQCINRANADCAPKSTSIKAPAPTISVSVPALVPTTSVSIQAPAPSPTVVYGGDQRPPADSNGYHSNGACIAEIDSRLLKGCSFKSDGMTYDKCSTHCANAGFSVAGVEFGRECYCDDYVSVENPSHQCLSTCAGDSSKFCGGGQALMIFKSSVAKTAATVNGWKQNKLCLLDNQNGRLFNGASLTDAGMTQTICTNYCNSKGFTQAGVEYGSECYCASGVSLSGPKSTSCDQACPGNDKEQCGGGNALWVLTK